MQDYSDYIIVTGEREENNVCNLDKYPKQDISGNQGIMIRDTPNQPYVMKLIARGNNRYFQP